VLRFLFIILLGVVLNAQNAPRTWHDELGFDTVNSVCKSGDYINNYQLKAPAIGRGFLFVPLQG